MSEQLPPLVTTPPGLYKHYKGMLYEVIGTVRHSEDLQPMTLYRALYGEHGLVNAQIIIILCTIAQKIKIVWIKIWPP